MTIKGVGRMTSFLRWCIRSSAKTKSALLKRFWLLFCSPLILVLQCFIISVLAIEVGSRDFIAALSVEEKKK